MKDLDRLHEWYCKLVGHAERLAESGRYGWSDYYYDRAEEAWRLYELALRLHKRRNYAR